MAAKQTAPFGTWTSPIKPADLTRGARSFGHRQASDGYIYWSEGRPEEKGRQVIVRARAGGKPEDILPAPFSARSRVHEYGGGEFLVDDGVVTFVNMVDQDLWQVTPGEAPVRLTNEPRMRFADMAPDPARRRLIAIGERHDGGDEHAAPDNLIVAVDLDGGRRGRVSELISGRDFFAFARVSPDGRALAYLGWDLPDMPWDQSALYVATLKSDGAAGRPRRIAGGNKVAAMQPQWLDATRLVFLSDETGFGNIHLWDGREVRALTRFKAELGLPMWNVGNRTFCVAGTDELIATGTIDDKPSLIGVRKLDAKRPEITVRPLNVASTGAIAGIDRAVATNVGFAKAPAAFATVPLARGGPAVLRAASTLKLDAKGLSVGRTVAFRGGDRKTTFAQFYPPASAGHRGPRGAAPPAIVLAHGGPTSQAGHGLGLRVQFYTSRGFAVLDVDYAGSTGYGRAYRERLDGQWGIADVADCAAGARFLGAEGLADPGRIAIAGGSAGGYTVLMALATTGAFAAGSSHYGISDLTLLMQHTHKFESGYLHRLLGTTPRNWKTVCEARSPITLIDGMTAPLVLFQGLDDKVVPPDQSRLIHERLRERGVATELFEFAGEGHGFRQAETIVTVIKAELAFLKTALRLG